MSNVAVDAAAESAHRKGEAVLLDGEGRMIDPCFLPTAANPRLLEGIDTWSASDGVSERDFRVASSRGNEAPLGRLSPVSCPATVTCPTVTDGAPLSN